MRLFEKINKLFLGNQDDVAITMNSSEVWLSFPRAMRYMSYAGILFGISYIWFALNKLWIHWPGAYWLVILATAIFICMCFVMIISSARSLMKVLMWCGMAYLSVALLFRVSSWPGGVAMLQWGIPNIIAICIAIGYLTHMPKAYQYIRKPLAWWVIGSQVVAAILWFIAYYHFDFVVEQFEPAIPYSDDCVLYQQAKIWRTKVITAGFGGTMLLLSCILCRATRKNQQ